MVVAPEDRVRNAVIYATIAAGLVVALLVVMAIVSFLSIHRAENDLSAAKTLIGNDLGNKSLLTSPSGRDQLTNDIATVQRDAALATNSLQGSVSLGLLGHLPIIGTQRHGVIQLSDDVETAATDASALLTSLDGLIGNSHGTTVSLPALTAFEVYVKQGHTSLASLQRPAAGLIGPLATARRAFNKEDAKLVHLLALSSRTISFALPFLGANGPQTYLVAGLNNAEMRDSGAVLSLAELSASNGTFTISDDHSYADDALSSPAPVPLPAGTQQVFGANQPSLNWPATDETADWATSGQLMQAMWQQATGQTVAGVIGIDVPGVAQILKLTGPVSVPGISGPISASNIGDQLLDKAYQGLTVQSSEATRREALASVVKAAINKMKIEHVDIDAFANALAADVAGRHLMVWSDVATDESGLVALDAAGTLNSVDPTRTFHVAIENSSADKLDYFVAVKLHMHVIVDKAGNALVNTTVTLANFALKNQPASYQYGPDDINAFQPGQYVARVVLWGPQGSIMPGSIPESGLQLTQDLFSLDPAQTRSVSFSVAIPHAVQHGRLVLRLVPQARLKPDALSLTLSAPAWTVSGHEDISTHLAATREFSWGLT
jgi:hypothetical protein